MPVDKSTILATLQILGLPAIIVGGLSGALSGAAILIALRVHVYYLRETLVHLNERVNRLENWSIENRSED